MHALVTADELVGEREARHEATLLEPEDGREGAREEDTLDGGERDEALGKARPLVCDPAEGPVSLLLDAGDGVNGVEEVLALLRVLDVGVNEERVCLGVDVLHHDLETVEAPRLGGLHLVGETLDEVLIDDTVRGGEECKDMRNEVALVVVHAVVPVVEVLGEVDLLNRPEGGFSLLVHLPDLRPAMSRRRPATTRRCTNLMILDGEQDESALRLNQQRLHVYTIM